MRKQTTWFQEGVRENSLWSIGRGIALATVLMSMVIFYPVEAFSRKSIQAIPPEYQDKQMPNGWLTNPQAIAAGKAIYEGETTPKVKCIGCHGEDGQPTRKGRGAPDFSESSAVHDSNAHWFWRISEGKRRTKMRSHKKQLTEEQRWQVIAYIRTFAKNPQ